MDRRSRTKGTERTNRAIEGKDEKVTVPTDLIGLVIGKKGQTFHEMERRTGAKIIVENNNVYVRGTPEQRQKARSEIQAIVDVSIDDILTNTLRALLPVFEKSPIRPRNVLLKVIYSNGTCCPR